jgi:hypothetical protein
MRAFVYWNSRVGLFSVRVDGRVKAHASRLIVTGVRFNVSEAGRERVLSSGHKNVHAGITGIIEACDCVRVEGSRLDDIPTWSKKADSSANHYLADGVRVRYNPYECGSFLQFDSGQPIEGAESVYCHAARLYSQAAIWALGVEL